jgi:hypothetical protein
MPVGVSTLEAVAFCDIVMVDKGVAEVAPVTYVKAGMLLPLMVIPAAGAGEGSAPMTVRMGLPAVA